MPQILVVESEPEGIRRIRELVSTLDAEVVVADSADAAERAIARQQPALVLTSTVTSPALEARVMAAVRSLPATMPVPVLTLPPLTDAAEPREESSASFLSFFTRLSPKKRWTHYDADALGERIREALAQSLEEREWMASRARLWTEAAERQVEAAFLKPAEPRERAPRFVGSEMSGFSQARLTWGLVVRIVNISRSGMLIESGTRFADGTRDVFELPIAGTPVRAHARFVRSLITPSEGAGVRYQTAVAFDADVHLPLDSPGARGADATDVSEPLHEVVKWLRDEAAGGMRPSELLATYELELQHLVRAREVRITSAPSVDDGCGTSVFFAVPGRTGETVVRATFEAGDRPSREALTLLKQAAFLVPDIVALDAVDGMSREM
jgi:hypothetical protein